MKGKNFSSLCEVTQFSKHLMQLKTDNAQLRLRKKITAAATLMTEH
jgi:hypothetical protein